MIAMVTTCNPRVKQSFSPVIQITVTFFPWVAERLGFKPVNTHLRSIPPVCTPYNIQYPPQRQNCSKYYSMCVLYCTFLGIGKRVTTELQWCVAWYKRWPVNRNERALVEKRTEPWKSSGDRPFPTPLPALLRTTWTIEMTINSRYAWINLCYPAIPSQTKKRRGAAATVSASSNTKLKELLELSISTIAPMPLYWGDAYDSHTLCLRHFG